MRYWRRAALDVATLTVITLAVLTACSSGTGTTGTTGTDSLTTTRTQVVARINQLRADSSLPALTEWTAGETCANGEASADAAANQVHSTFGNCGESAQNECPAWTALAQLATGCVQTMWNEGPGDFSTHGDYTNMASATYTRVAVGIALTSSGTVWSVLNFAP